MTSVRAAVIFAVILVLYKLICFGVTHIHNGHTV